MTNWIQTGQNQWDAIDNAPGLDNQSSTISDQLSSFWNDHPVWTVLIAVSGGLFLIGLTLLAGMAWLFYKCCCGVGNAVGAGQGVPATVTYRHAPPSDIFSDQFSGSATHCGTCRMKISMNATICPYCKRNAATGAKD